MKFFKSILAYSINLFSFLSNRVDVKALELKEKTEQEINIPVLRAEYENTVNDKLDIQYNAVVKLTADIKLLNSQYEKDKTRLQLTANEIIKLEEEQKTVNIENETPIEKMNREYGLMNMSLEASTLLGDIQFNQKFIGQQQQTLEAMVKNYHENRLNAKRVISELQSLEQRNTLIETKQSIEQIELGISNYKIADIVKIVDGKEAVFEAQQFADSVLLREGGKTVTDLQIEKTANLQLEHDLNNYLKDVKEGKQVLLN